jgi:hypothetical protein
MGADEKLGPQIYANEHEFHHSGLYLISDSQHFAAKPGHLQCNPAGDFFSATIIPSEIHWIQRSAH